MGDYLTSMYEDGSYLAKNPEWHQRDSAWKANQIATILEKNGVVPRNVAEVGCGAGGILAALAERYGDSVLLSGYEISPQAYEICSRKTRANLTFHLESLLDSEDTFDVVMAIDVFEHIPDYMGFLRQLREKGTHKVFHIPLDLSMQTVLRAGPIMNARTEVGHLHYFTKETALATLRDCGYDIVDHAFTSGTLDLPSHGWRARVARLPRRVLFAANQELAARILGGFSLLVLAT